MQYSRLRADRICADCPFFTSHNDANQATTGARRAAAINLRRRRENAPAPTLIRMCRTGARRTSPTKRCHTSHKEGIVAKAKRLGPTIRHATTTCTCNDCRRLQAPQANAANEAQTEAHRATTTNHSHILHQSGTLESGPARQGSDPRRQIPHRTRNSQRAETPKRHHRHTRAQDQPLNFPNARRPSAQCSNKRQRCGVSRCEVPHDTNDHARTWAAT